MPLTENDLIRIRQFLQKMESGLIEGQEVFATYHDSNLAATPSDPTGDGTTGGWHREPTEASNWMSTKTAFKDTGGSWGTPIRVFGLQGTETAGVGLSADIPKLTQITFIGDGESKVGWTAGTVEYGGNSYAIVVKAVGDGSTNAYIYWDDADGQTSFKTTDTFATAIAANHWVVCINDDGKAIPATSARILHGGLIQAGTVTASVVIVAGTVTDTELASGVNDDIAQGIADAATAQAAAVAAQGTANSKINTFYQDSVPTALAAGDIWYDTNDNNKMYRATSAGDDQVTAGEWENVNVTTIDGGNIQTGTILAGSIGTGEITAIKMAANSITAENAAIANLAVDTLQIANLAVETAKLDDDAATTVVSESTDGEIGISEHPDWTTIESAAFTSVGRIVKIATSIQTSSNYAGGTQVYIEILRDAVVIFDNAGDSFAALFEAWENHQFDITDLPGSGSVTYYVKLKANNAQALAKLRLLVVEENIK